MYLEISGRRTGKTKRIILKAYELASINFDFVITGLSQNTYPMDLQKYFVDVEENFTSVPILLCDEFEYCLKNTSVQQANSKNWYVCGTPKYEISPTLQDLLKVVPIYCRYSHIGIQKQDPNITGVLSINEFKSQILGEFIDND